MGTTNANMIAQLEAIKHTDDNGVCYWEARELCKVFGYSTYQKFETLIEKAKQKVAEYHDETNHFNVSVKMVKVGSGAWREVTSIQLTQKACYVIATLAVRKKEEVKEALRYFSPYAQNQYYVKKYTDEAGAFYLNRMKQLEKVEELVCDNSYNRNGEREHSTHHIMYKLPTMYVEHGDVGYEFLIEYDESSPSVGIYYGCKAFVVKGDFDRWLKQFNKEWEAVKGVACQVLNNTFPNKDFTYRFRTTDNANDGNFWPFWIALYEDEDIIEVGVRALKIIKNIYDSFVFTKRYHGLDITLDQKTIETETAFTLADYQELHDFIYYGNRKDERGKHRQFQEGVDYFERFIAQAEARNYIERNNYYDKAWVVKMDNNDFANLLECVFNELNKKYNQYHGGNGDRLRKVPWRSINKLFLNGQGNAFGKDALRNGISKERSKYEDKQNAVTVLNEMMQ